MTINITKVEVEEKLETLELLKKYEEFIQTVEVDLKGLKKLKLDVSELINQNNVLKNKLSKLELENKKLKSMKAYRISKKYWNFRNKIKGM